MIMSLGWRKLVLEYNQQYKSSLQQPRKSDLVVFIQKKQILYSQEEHGK